MSKAVQNFVPIRYEKRFERQLIAFLTECLPQSGRALDINGRHSYYKDIESSFKAFWCMFDNEDIIGAVAVGELSEKNCELKSLYLLEKYHGRGYGRLLLEAAVGYASAQGYEAMYLDTFSTSTKAVALYRRAGFEDIPKYNDSERSDVFMRLNLKAKAVRIRTVIPEDAQAICKISSEDLGYECDTALVQKKIANLDPNREVVFAAVIGGEVVGYIHAEVYSVLYFEDMVNYLGLAVDGRYRRMGVGTALVKAAEDWAVHRGIRQIRLNSGGSRTDAHEFYKRLDYDGSKFQLRFVKEL